MNKWGMVVLLLGIGTGVAFSDTDRWGNYMSMDGIGQLRGTTYFSMGGTQYHWGNDTLDAVFKESYGFDATVNYNVSSNVDFVINYAGAWDSAMGIDVGVSSGDVGLNYLFNPESTFTPYIGGGVGVACAYVGDFSDSYLTLEAQAGSEWSLNKRFLIDANVMYVYVDTDVNGLGDDVGAHVMAGVFVSDKVLFAVGGSHFFDAGVSTLELSISFK